MSTTSSGKGDGERVIRRTLANGTIKEYRYPKRRQPKALQQGADTIAGMLRSYRMSQEWAKKSAKTKSNYNIYHQPLEAIGHIRTADLTRHMILSIRDAIHSARGPGAAVGFVRATSAFLSWVVGRGLIRFHPLHGYKMEAGGELPTWTEEVYARSMRELSEPHRRAVMLAAFTAQRRSDLIDLRWRDFDGTHISLVQDKTKTRLKVPAHRELRTELRKWRGDRKDEDTILVAPRGQPWTPEHFSRELGKAVRKFGLGRFTPHGLRKLAAVRMAAAGCTTHEIAAICGWKTLSMVQHYTKDADQKTMADSAMKKLENFQKRPRKSSGTD